MGMLLEACRSPKTMPKSKLIIFPSLALHVILYPSPPGIAGIKGNMHIYGHKKAGTSGEAEYKRLHKLLLFHLIPRHEEFTLVHSL